MSAVTQGEMPFVGLINILKLPGMSSHSIISRIRNIYNIKRVGHTGTLDPYAGGILLVALGPATRLCDYIDDSEKSYLTEISLGCYSVSGDAEKPSAFFGDISAVTDEDIHRVAATFLGTTMQTPPIYSAISIDGKRAYEFARGEQQVDIKKREINISQFDILKIEREAKRIKIRAHITCSKGTYIRSIAVDFGEILGVGGMLSFLLRTAVGNFRLKDAVTCDELFEMKKEGIGEEYKYIQPPDTALYHINSIILPLKHENYRGGVNITVSEPDGLYRVYIEDEFIGLGIVKSGRLCPKINLTNPNITAKKSR